MIRAVLLLVGYLFGLFETGWLYGKKKGVNLRKEGSGNMGATNSLRVMGLKAGLIVFFGDFLKCFVPTLAVGLIFRERAPEAYHLYMMYTACGVVIGHNYPLFLQFHGGKGIACTAGMMAAIKLFPHGVLLLAAFFLVAGLTSYVSLGSLTAVTGVTATLIVMAVSGSLGLAENLIPEFIVLCVFWWAMAIWRHRDNINRLLHGNENKLSLKKKRNDP